MIDLLPKGLAENRNDVSELQHILREKQLDLEYKISQLKKEKRELAAQTANIKKLHNQLILIESDALNSELIPIAKMFPMIVSKRELEVLYCMSKFLSNKQVADVLYISTKTAKFHKSNIYRRTGLKGEKEILKYMSSNK